MAALHLLSVLGKAGGDTVGMIVSKVHSGVSIVSCPSPVVQLCVMLGIICMGIILPNLPLLKLNQCLLCAEGFAPLWSESDPVVVPIGKISTPRTAPGAAMQLNSTGGYLGCMAPITDPLPLMSLPPTLHPSPRHLPHAPLYSQPMTLNSPRLPAMSPTHPMTSSDLRPTAPEFVPSTPLGPPGTPLGGFSSGASGGGLAGGLTGFTSAPMQRAPGSGLGAAFSGGSSGLLGDASPLHSITGDVWKWAPEAELAGWGAPAAAVAAGGLRPLRLDAEKCVICLEGPKDTTLAPCGHRALCR